jgi:phage major head subunit gpT-like protein
MLTERAVLGMFFERLKQAMGMSWIDSICTSPFDSDQDSEEYNWLGMVPQLSKKGAKKSFSQVRENAWIVDNVEYQGGIQFPKKHILYDKTGQVQIRINELVDRARAHWISIVAPLIINGAANTCYDDQYFFDTDHEEGASGGQDNNITVDISALPSVIHGSTLEPSSSEMVHCIMKAVEQMLSFKDDKGEYVNEDMTEFLVLLPTTLLTEGLAALRASTIDGGDTNILFEQDSFKFRVQASPRFSSWSSTFALFGTQGNQKPIIRQQRSPNQGGNHNSDGLSVEQLWLNSEHCKLNDECLLSIETERAVAYGDWKKACLVTME